LTLLAVINTFGAKPNKPMNKKLSAFTLIELLVVITIIAILASIALPVFSSVTERANQTKDLSNAKQIGLACKLFAGDHDGKFPFQNGQVDPPADIAPPGGGSNSNQIFASLVPAYVPTEKIFYLAKSFWSPTAPDEKTTVAADRVEEATNSFAYMFGLSDTDNPNYPLIFDSPTAALTTYPTNPALKGGVWKGKKAVVIHTDQSGTVENTTTVTATTYNIMGKTGGAVPADILVPAVANNWMDPAVNSVIYPDTP
jgi:prepilin-type N-terminal cleavage/methylation domain-containing protein